MRSSPLYRSGLFVDDPSERATSPVMATTTH